jgi:hypothetical protein
MTIPEDLLQRMDTIRGDIPSSKYVTRLLEKKFSDQI